jgi:hypothetical protein
MMLPPSSRTQAQAKPRANKNLVLYYNRRGKFEIAAEL